MHITVLLDEAIDSLITKKDGRYVDATFGRGGHSRRILEHLSKDGRLMAIDKDPLAIAEGEKLEKEDDRFIIKQGAFSEIDVCVKDMGWGGSVDGVIFDLGVSSPQLDENYRGFSFMHDGPLDMRMDTTQGETAEEWLARASAEEICGVLKTYGEEKFAWRIAKEIVRSRQETPISRTLELSKMIEDIVPIKEKHKHPATRSFQAIRIYINQELKELETAINKMKEILVSKGRFVVISFHSLEDRIVKQYVKAQEKGPFIPSYLPIDNSQQWSPVFRKIGAPIKPTAREIESNNRSRSAIMRVVEKL
jgi:16S rRNA (cytosine1402-N4)-methyltransferase